MAPESALPRLGRSVPAGPGAISARPEPVVSGRRRAAPRRSAPAYAAGVVPSSLRNPPLEVARAHRAPRGERRAPEVLVEVARQASSSRRRRAIGRCAASWALTWRCPPARWTKNTRHRATSRATTAPWCGLRPPAGHRARAAAPASSAAPSVTFTIPALTGRQAAPRASHRHVRSHHVPQLAGLRLTGRSGRISSGVTLTRCRTHMIVGHSGGPQRLSAQAK